MAPIFGSRLLSRASFILVISAFSAACWGVGASCATGFGAGKLCFDFGAAFGVRTATTICGSCV